MEIDLPYKVDMSVNMMYRATRQGKFLTEKALRLRAQIIEDIKEMAVDNLNIREKKITVGIIFTENWECKNGEIKRVDLDNRLKFLIDSVFRALDLDDKMIFELYARKNQSETAEYTTFIINEVLEVEEW